jgi:flavin-dependent dehydrogenase
MRQRRGIDVSCTIANPTAGPGYFLTGDAASIVDPLSSHGILKAVMSGMKAAHHSAAVLRRGVSPEAAANSYHDWLARWFIGPLSSRRALSRYWPGACVMIGSGEHLRVTSRGVPLQSVLPNFTRKVPDLMSIAKD